MKLRFVVFFLLIVWIIASDVSRAQQTTYLKLQPDRLQNARETERQAIANHDSRLLAEAYYLYGKTYALTGDYRTAHRYFLKSLRIQEPRGNSEELSRLYFRLSNIENKQGHVKQALQYARQSFQIAQALRSNKELIRASIGVGQVYANIWNDHPEGNQTYYDSSLFFYTKAEYLCNKLKDTIGVAEVSTSLGELLSDATKPQAIAYLKKALSLFRLKHKDPMIVNVMSQLAILYLQEGQITLARQMLEEAEKHYDSRKIDDYDTRIGLDTRFIRYFEKTGQWKQAYERLRAINTLEKAVLRADHQGAITKLNVEYETEKREALLQAKNSELRLHTENLQTQQRLTIASLALLGMATSMSVVFFRLYRKNQRISHQNEELVKEQNHRVKNNLQVVSSLLSLQSKRLSDETAKKAIEESRLRVQAMAIVHRRLYDGKKLAEVNLDEFIRELVQGVLKAFGYPTLQPVFTIDPISLTADKAIPLGLIVNELVTNACKYAFPTNKNPVLRISLRRNHTKLACMVADNGPGFDSPDPLFWEQDSFQAVQNLSFGMALIEAQVAQLSGTYSFNTGVDMRHQGTIFTMECKA